MNEPWILDVSELGEPGRRPNDIRFARALCGELVEAERREWWLANGRGAYAAGTVAGTLTRGYHGLLIAPVEPPLGRRLLLAKLDATLVAGERRWPLFGNRWADGRVEPAGHALIESFRLSARQPIWHWACDELLIEQRIWMPRGGHRVCVAYRLARGAAGPAPGLSIAILCTDRDHHRVSERADVAPSLSPVAGRLELALAAGSRLVLCAHGGALRPAMARVEPLMLGCEQARGLPHLDTHWRVGFAQLRLRHDAWCGVSALLAPAEPAPARARPRVGRAPAPRTSLQRLARREQALLRIARVHLAALAPLPTWIEQLILAADSFIIERAIAASSAPATPVMGRSVIAGYPWFGDWGRDTMIALPGLTLMTGRHRLARRILETYAGFVDRGMLPNRLPERGEPPEYHAVDAALWFIEAWRAYMHTTWDWAALARVFPVLESIIAHYRAGTRHGIVMDPADGLISAGAPGLQLTWMDAKVEDWVVTPRIGKPVEVNALWYQGLRSMADFAMYVNQDPLPYRRQAEHTLRGFARFVRADGQGLHDVLDGPNGDESRIRPNQLLAVSLSHSPIAPSTCAAVVEVCARHLLCSHGLRSLAPLDPDYQGVYAGDVRRRDGAYHQGTVWAWLLGHHALAEYRVSGDAARAQRLLEPLADQLWDAGVGSLGEIFDGDPPHRPRGCPAQAWSVACVLEAWVRLERARRGG